MAYLFDRNGDPHRRDLAATAATAFADDGPLADLPFARALLVRSAEIAAEYDEELEAESPLLDALTAFGLR